MTPVTFDSPSFEFWTYIVIGAFPFITGIFAYIIYRMRGNLEVDFDDAVESHFGCSRVDWYNTAVRIQTRCSYCGTERRYDIKQCPGCGAMEE